MSSLADVFRVLNAMRDEGIVREYAVGGATAVLFYAEATRTYDLDVFVVLATSSPDPVLSLAPLYEWATTHSFVSEAEHVIVHGVPVQFLPAYNRLVEEAVTSARTHDYDGTPVRVVGPEHLLALQAGDARRRERARQLLESRTVDRVQLRDVLTRHALSHIEVPTDE